MPGSVTTRVFELGSVAPAVSKAGVLHLKISVVEEQVPVKIEFPPLQMPILLAVMVGMFGNGLTVTAYPSDVGLTQPSSVVVMV